MTDWRRALYESRSALSPAQLKWVSQRLTALVARSETPIWRGVRRQTDSMSVVTRVAPRKAANTEDLYRQVLDNNPLNANYPRRDQSHICSTYMLSAMTYGKVNLVIPLEPTPVGICPGRDMWSTFTGPTLNSLFSDHKQLLGLQESEELSRSLDDGDLEGVYKYMSYDRHNFELVNYGAGFTVDHVAEVWFSGPALYIPLSVISSLAQSSRAFKALEHISPTFVGVHDLAPVDEGELQRDFYNTLSTTHIDTTTVGSTSG